MRRSGNSGSSQSIAPALHISLTKLAGPTQVGPKRQPKIRHATNSKDVEVAGNKQTGQCVKAATGDERFFLSEPVTALISWTGFTLVFPSFGRLVPSGSNYFNVAAVV